MGLLSFKGPEFECQGVSVARVLTLAFNLERMKAQKRERIKT